MRVVCGAFHALSYSRADLLPGLFFPGATRNIFFSSDLLNKRGHVSCHRLSQRHRQSPKLGGLAALDVQEPLGNPSQSARTVVPTSADDQNMGVGLEELPTTYYLLLAAYCYSNCGPTLRKVKAIPRAADDDLVSVRLRVGVRVGVRVRVRLGLGLA